MTDTIYDFKIINDLLYKKLNKRVVENGGHIWYQCSDTVRVGDKVYTNNTLKEIVKENKD